MAIVSSVQSVTVSDKESQELKVREEQGSDNKSMTRKVKQGEKKEENENWEDMMMKDELFRKWVNMNNMSENMIGGQHPMYFKPAPMYYQPDLMMDSSLMNLNKYKHLQMTQQMMQQPPG